MPARRPNRDDALALARRSLLDGDRIDMQRLAARLQVNRVTLYRWFGNRDQLLVEVLWSLTERNLNHWWRRLESKGGPRVPELLASWTRSTLETPGLLRFLHGESGYAIRLLTFAAGGFQPRVLALVRDLIQRDLDEGRVHSPLPVDELAYTVLRVCESYIYLPSITGATADPAVLQRVLAVLLPPV